MLLLFIGCFTISRCYAQTWCNKNYLPNQPVVPPGGQFYLPESSPTPLLSLRCSPIISPYVEEEDFSAGVVVDAFVTYTHYNGTQPISIAAEDTLQVLISYRGRILSEAVARLNSTSELRFPLANLSQPRKQPFIIDCTALYASSLSSEPQKFSATTALFYVPPPTVGSVTKRDSRTGALLVKSRGSKSYEAIFPFGFYTSFDKYLDNPDLRIVDELKAQGFTIVHPVPTFSNWTALEKVLDRMEELDLYFIYDMRHTYRDIGALTMEVNRIKHRPNLLLWYTADEPDGTSDPLDAPRITYDIINTLDGYHPVSLVLNCADYEFAAYASGAEVIMPDTYTIANDPKWSAKYNTTCTEDFGCCGCDNCRGEFEDISRRLDDFAMRLDVLAWSRDKVVWSVPQAFGGEEFWTRPPTGREFAVQVILSVNHGARGIMPWIDPTPADLKSTASQLVKALNSDAVKGFIFNPLSTFERLVSDRIDIGMWTSAGEILMLVANLNEHGTSIVTPLASSLLLREVINEGVRAVGRETQLGLELEGLGYAIFIMSPRVLVTQRDEF
ncbi:hypothetical protein R3P38DRAFT_2890684 [Favolaschia claudopus]|uniref:Uncharacterized protein n=1 Tax=Favolaschia claudopus TaxID=2862362 RepID=A0AAW0CW43_9AGAR